MTESTRPVPASITIIRTSTESLLADGSRRAGAARQIERRDFRLFLPAPALANHVLRNRRERRRAVEPGGKIVREANAPLLEAGDEDVERRNRNQRRLGGMGANVMHEAHGAGDRQHHDER